MAAENRRQQEGVADTSRVALYIASVAEELSRLAKGHDLEALAYLLDMARLEADQVSKHWVAPDRQPARGLG